MCSPNNKVTSTTVTMILYCEIIYRLSCDRHLKIARLNYPSRYIGTILQLTRNSHDNSPVTTFRDSAGRHYDHRFIIMIMRVITKQFPFNVIWRPSQSNLHDFNGLSMDFPNDDHMRITSVIHQKTTVTISS